MLLQKPLRDIEKKNPKLEIELYYTCIMSNIKMVYLVYLRREQCLP